MAGIPITYTTPKILASGATFAQLQAGNLAGMLDLVTAANPAITNPATAPTVAVTGGGSTGGLLPAGVYFVSYAWDNGVGRTLPKESASSFTVASGNIPRVTIPALPTGVASAHIYLTAAGGASGTEVLYAAGVTTLTFDLAVATYQPSNGTLPTANTTALSSLSSFINMGRGRYFQQLYEAFTDTLDSYLSGQPMDGPTALNRLRTLAAALKTVSQAADDCTSLCFANTGTVGSYSPGPGLMATRRTWP